MASGFNVLTRAMTADVADEVRLEQGKERTGLLFAITTLTGKLAGAFAISLTFTALDRVGFVPRLGLNNTPAAIQGLELVYIVGPIIFVMAGGLAFVGYKLSAERHGEIRRQLDERDAAYDEAPVVATLAQTPGEARAAE
jgi:Na+/melibiose symporter-like transporter